LKSVSFSEGLGDENGGGGNGTGEVEVKWKLSWLVADGKLQVSVGHCGVLKAWPFGDTDTDAIRSMVYIILE
jgi:hypothetical protein